eukprot:GFUD01005098.1.p1 GENE.GFUD01005098.1~~GFUD01005098.1.p1  ORF type:complete len:1563 (+),score=315.45 GFUD01005098.1:146-4834(+)
MSSTRNMKSTLCSETSQSRAVRQSANTCDAESSSHLYQNISVSGSAKIHDPFEDFEDALRKTSKIRIKKASFCSIEEDPSESPRNNVDVICSESPPVPGKKCSRSISQISRLSVQSSSSSKSHNSARYSYDEVSLCSNFGKPVIVKEPDSPKVDDIFSSVSFISPLTDVSPSRRGLFQSRVNEDNMNSIDSITSSLPSKTKEYLHFQNSDIDEDDPYEDIEEIRKSIAKKIPKSSHELAKFAPEPPPRNSILKPESIYENHERLARENIYSECDTSGDSIKVDVEKNKNLMDDIMISEDDVLSYDESENEYEDTDDVVQKLGAIPKTSNSRMTIDIRSKVSQWYEEAEKEVERDLSLDISLLENRQQNKKRPKKQKAAYEHISMAITGKPILGNGEIVPRPTMTLLRDFDPCFDDEEENIYSQNQVNDDKETGEVYRVDNEIYDQIDGMQITEPNEKDMKIPIAMPRTKFPRGSPKKINFGPPKPPRSFNYLPLDKPDKSEIQESKHKGEIEEEPIKREQKNIESPKKSTKKLLKAQLSDKNLFKSSKTSKNSKSKNGNKCENNSCNEKDSLKKDILTDEANENIYVTIPVHKVSDISDSEESPRPPSSTPPPLPLSQPPRSFEEKNKPTMYENVWVEPDTGTISLDLPPIPPRPGSSNKNDYISGKTSETPVDTERANSDSHKTDIFQHCDTKTSRLEGIFFNRKMSQESLASHGSETARSKFMNHQKSESIDSGSSSSYSLTSDSPTLLNKNCDNSSKNSLENLDSLSGSPKKSKLKKFPSTRSFTVGNLGPRLNKLPELASNIRRRMSDHIKPIGNLGKSPHDNSTLAENSSIFLETPENSDPEADISETKPEVVTKMKRNSFLMSEALKPGTKNQTGALYVLSRSKKVFQCKWCILGHGNIRWYNEETSLAIPKETILLSNIFSVTKRNEKHLGPNQKELLCFDLAVLNSKGKYCVYLFGASSSRDRETWLEKIVQSLSYRLASYSMSQSMRLGWAYVKLGFAAEWNLSWLSLSNRYLCYTTQDGPEVENIDLKKTKDMFVRKDSKNLCLPQGFSKHPVLVCDFNDRSLYILLGAERECNAWKVHIEQIAFNNSNILREQQVTHEDIPVIVDKCVKFVYSHGVMTEGIYRLAGGNIKINKLLSEFRSNAWAVQISREDYSEHDVANVLKRFIRQLDEPLLTEHLRESFMKAARIENQDEKLDKYRELLNKLPTINYNTLRRLMGHLHIVADQCEKNLMPVYNLSPLWGPNMLTVDGQEASQFAQTSGEMEVFHAIGNISTLVCADLITNYPWLFNVDNLEVEKERRMLEVLEKINFPTPTSVKRSGDIRMWIYIESRTSGDCVSLILHPSLTAGEALRRAGDESNIPLHTLDKMFIHEVVLGGSLERPLHHSEKMLDVTLRWGTWDAEDRHDNYLLLKTNQFYLEALPCAIPPLSVFAEVQFSENKAKSKFSTFLFSVSKANITYYKEEKTGIPTELGAWPVEDINWYIGSEPKRGAPFNLNITFIPKNEEIRIKESPLFGRVMSFNSRELFVKWIAALLVAEHQNDLLPPPSLVMID